MTLDMLGPDIAAGVRSGEATYILLPDGDKVIAVLAWDTEINYTLVQEAVDEIMVDGEAT